MEYTFFGIVSGVIRRDFLRTMTETSGIMCAISVFVICHPQDSEGGEGIS